MLKKLLPAAILMLLAIAPLGIASAADKASNCRLKGGSIVPLAAEICAMEGGTLIADAVYPAPVTPTEASSAVQQTGDPKLLAAQRAVIELLNKAVIEKNSQQKIPEGIERTARFDGCRLQVEESMHVDYGNLISAKMNFKISSTVDLRNINRDAFGVLGKISSLGGGLKAHAVYVEEPKRKKGNNIAISVLEQKAEGSRKYVVPGLVAFWDAPRDDLLMTDEYGYPVANSLGNIATDRIRMLFIVNTSDDATALGKALDDVHVLCRP